MVDLGEGSMINAEKSSRSRPKPTTTGDRGERLYPPRSSRIYWVLTRLREEIDRIGLEYLSGHRDGRARLVDFGAGNSPYRPLLSDHVAEYIACDLAGNETADRVLERPDVLPFDDRSVDIVLSSQVLEHTVAPDLYLSECARVLPEGGLLVLSTHGVWRYHPDPVDLWRWTSEGLKRSVTRAGFSIVSFRGILGPSAYGLQIWQDAVLPRLHHRLHSIFAWAMQRWIQAADSACPPAVRDADASVFILVARKLADVCPPREST
jgi:SAM-dependent methyltransferase